VLASCLPVCCPPASLTLHTPPSRFKPAGSLKGTPQDLQLMIFLDSTRNAVALKEAYNKNIPTIAIVNSAKDMSQVCAFTCRMAPDSLLFCQLWQCRWAMHSCRPLVLHRCPVYPCIVVFACIVRLPCLQHGGMTCRLQKSGLKPAGGSCALHQPGPGALVSGLISI
jgi:hypothetical protein